MSGGEKIFGNGGGCLRRHSYSQEGARLCRISHSLIELAGNSSSPKSQMA